MKVITLQRLPRGVANQNAGTFGVMLDALGYPLCVTLEDEWLDNEPFKSSIPASVYICNAFTSDKFGKCY